jgi:hypothetical protein
MRPTAVLLLVCFIVQVAGIAPALAQPGSRTIQLGMSRSTIVAFDSAWARLGRQQLHGRECNVVSRTR